MQQFTLGDLKVVLRECAGVDESVDFESDIQNRSFDDLGYDSLALLETAAKIEKTYGVAIPDDAVGDFQTPQDIINYVNGK